jgi:hypothetical protein
VRFIDRSGHEPQTPDLTGDNAELYREVDEWIAFRKEFPDAAAIEERVDAMRAAAKEIYIRNISYPGLGPIGQARQSDIFQAAKQEADSLLQYWQNGGKDLMARVEASNLPSGERIGFRETPYKDLLRDKLADAGVPRLPRAPTSGEGGRPSSGGPEGGGPEGGGTPTGLVPEGGGFWGA